MWSSISVGYGASFDVTSFDTLFSIFCTPPKIVLSTRRLEAPRAGRFFSKHRPRSMPVGDYRSYEHFLIAAPYFMANIIISRQLESKVDELVNHLERILDYRHTASWVNPVVFGSAYQNVFCLSRVTTNPTFTVSRFRCVYRSDTFQNLWSSYHL